MPRTRRARKAKKQRGGNDLSVEEVLTMLSEAVMPLNDKKVTVVMESEDGETDENEVSMSEYVVFAMGKLMIDKGYDKAQVLAALKTLDNLAPSDEFSSYSLTA